ncbi:MAG: hypothetical protein FWC18_03585 [Cystobacterineae bacterium]|nr:hypothetical protein [Cystobacterineae bacterium]
MFCKKVVSITMALALAGMAVISSSAYAQSYEATGTVSGIWNEPGDEFIFTLNNKGICGSQHFHISRANSNYKEMVAMVLTALAANKTVGVYVTGCRTMYGTNRNIISHGFILR